VPYVNLQTARVRAMHIKGLLLDRVDPKETYKWKEREEKTFAQLADEWIALQKPSQRYNANLLLKVHGEALANKLVFQITKHDIDKAITPLKLEHPIQAKRAIKLWSKVLDYAEFRDYRAGPNPAAGRATWNVRSRPWDQHGTMLHCITRRSRTSYGNCVSNKSGLRAPSRWNF
jgi:hypothetical protein